VVGQLSLAAFASAARGLAPQALVHLRANHPGVTASLAVIEPDEGVPLVTRGDLDLLVVQDWFNAPLAVSDGLIKAPLLDDIVDIALPAGHALARRDVIELHEVAREPWISWTRRSICHDWLLLTLRAQGIEPTIAHNAGEAPTQLALVAAGFGVCILPRLGRGELPRGVRIVAVRPGLSRHVYAIWRADAARRPVIRAAVQALRTAAAAIDPRPPAPRKRRR
jgi:DNA-binding transcriptional LysR family regulator